MKVLVFFFAVLAVAFADFMHRYPYGRYPGDETYAASLGGAPVGLYDRRGGRGGHGYPYGYGRGRGDEVLSASLGGAKVGVYGNEHGRRY